MKTKTTILATICFLLISCFNYAQTPYKVKDTNPAATNSFVSQITNVNNTLFFIGYDPTYGLELWKSDGTEAGTAMVKDINVGGNNSSPSSLTNVNGMLFFRADDGVHGNELWKSDGTEEGTVLVKDISPSNFDNVITQITEIINIGNLVYFNANDGVHKLELWKSDGTEIGTVMVKDINTGSSYAGSSLPNNLINVNGTLFFSGFVDINGFELWKSDGTEAGTVMVKDIGPGNQDGMTSYPFMTNVNGTLFFVANDGIYVHERELWKSDGTEAGTVMVKDIFPGNNGYTANSSAPWDLKNVNGTLFFTAQDGIHGVELWKSDGTEAGTVMVKDITLGINTSYPNALSNCNNILYFSADDGVNGLEPWKSDGTESGTVMVKDLASGPYNSEPNEFTYLNGNVYFVGNDAIIGRELFRTDGTSGGTVGYNIATNGSSIPQYLTVVNNTLFFSWFNAPTNLWALTTAPLSIDENSFTEMNISIYPNPTKDIVYIKNPSNFTIDKIVITDLTGKKVMEQKSTSTDINVSQLQLGLYSIQIQSNERTFVSKFIKN